MARLRLCCLLAFAALLQQQLTIQALMPPQQDFSQADFSLESYVFSMHNIRGDIIVTGRLHSLLTEEIVDFKIRSGHENLTCPGLTCEVCRSPDFECVECKSPRATITMAEDVVFGVCDGHTFNKNGILEREDNIDCETDDLSGRSLLPSKWKDCYDGDNKRKYFQMGLVMTDKLVKNKFDGNIRHAKVWASALFAEANLVYAYQLNVELELAELYIQMDTNRMPNSCNDVWNSNCEKQCFDRRLDELTEWVKCLEDEALGSWQLVDDIPKSPGAGVAYVGSMCKPHFNTGFMSYSNSLWRTFAHELGHNFNAWHPMEGDLIKTENAGIMGYGDGKYNGEYQFDTENKGRICGAIDEAVDSCEAFKTTSQASCGDGIVGGNEECECLLGVYECDCCKNCKLRSGAQCNPFDNVAGCCSNDCKFTVATHRCDDDKGYCNRGTCAYTHPSLEICDVQQCTLGLRRIEGDDPCRFSGWRSQGESLHFVEDGALCGGGSCVAGVCRNNAGDELTPAPTRDPNSATRNPTRRPSTFAPSPQPKTSSPTRLPTSKAPTRKPTTKSPTAFPTKYQTKFPTIGKKTGEPSPYPTPFPTSPYPTKFPVTYPTFYPTTSKPTVPYPTRYPTQFPIKFYQAPVEEITGDR